MDSPARVPFSIVLETTEPFGSEVQVMHVTAVTPEDAAAQALRDWHNTGAYAEALDVTELEDGTVRVLAVLHGYAETALTRTPSNRLA